MQMLTIVAVEAMIAPDQELIRCLTISARLC